MKVENENLTSLYVLVFPDRSMLKVGKANNVRARGQLLRPVWGDIDYSESYELIAPTSVVFKLEKSLHFLLSGHKADVGKADGHTEMFELAAIDTVVMHIELFVSALKFKASLKKGVTEPKRISETVGGDCGLVDLRGASAKAAIGHIGVSAWAVFSIIKEYLPSSSPSIAQISDAVCMGEDSVLRALRVLRGCQMLEVKKVGRRNSYRICGG